MPNTLIIAENTLEPLTWKEFKADDTCQFLKEYFGKWPDTARIYHEQVSEANDVTPSDESTVERLSKLEGRFYVMVYPGDPNTIIIAIIAVAAAAAAAFLLAPALPGLNNRSQPSASPNNELANRTNRPRPKERIPDIFGSVISTPDLIALPYKIFENNIEVEYAYMCIGRGEYSVYDIKDDRTLVSSIEGTKIEVYAPFTSPNSGHAPQLSIGEPINTPIYNVSRSNAVNGQLLKAPNANNVKIIGNCMGVYPNEIHADTDSGVDFREYFKVDQTLNVEELNYSGVSLAGSFQILSVSEFVITIVPSGGWLHPSFVGNSTSWQDAFLFVVYDDWIGPFIMEGSDITKVYNNFVAPNGLFVDDGTAQYAFQVELKVEVTPVDVFGSPIALPVNYLITMQGSAADRSSRAVTQKIETDYTGPVSVRAIRLTGTPLDYPGQVSDDIKWRDLYSVAEAVPSQFGNVTTVQAVTVATTGALTIKDRKLNMGVSRKINVMQEDGLFSTELIATKNAGDILVFVSLDARIGNRQIQELDIDNIYQTIYDISAYFGTDKTTEFSYTFDDANTSFEETVYAIASAIYCVAYRRGNVIKLSFEKGTDDSTLLFNHRNKLPGSETRSVRFGNVDDNDGVELEYVSDIDGASVTYYLPEDRSSVNPKLIKTVGVKPKIQAYFHALRAWNKIRYQNISTQFEATQEADLLVLRDRILVTDNTRSNSQDGEIYSQNGLELELSQAIDVTSSDHTIFIQHVDGSVENLAISQGDDLYHVVLAQPPKAALALANDLYARATFAIVGTESARKTLPFLVSEKNPMSNFIIEINAINYDDRYYQNDGDYVNGIVDENGDTI